MVLDDSDRTFTAGVIRTFAQRYASSQNAKVLDVSFPQWHAYE